MKPIGIATWDAVGLLGTVAVILAPTISAATPQFARKYAASCRTCHAAVPKLNQFGEDFLASGYRMPEQINRPANSTIPLAVWATARGQWDVNRDRSRGLPNRVELISAGPVGTSRAFYFLEWLPVSQEVGANNQRVERHGRFEDLFLSLPIGPAYFTVGQFRQMSQVDVSRQPTTTDTPLANGSNSSPCFQCCASQTARA